MVNIGFLYTRLRVEEKYLIEEFEKNDQINVIRINDGDDFFDISKPDERVDVLFERSISYNRGLYISKIYSSNGIPVVNTPQVAEICGDKYVTSQLLTKFNVPTPKVYMAFEEESALKAIETMGYPCVLKPVVGSWGRLLSKINDRPSAESILEHKSALGVNHQIFYIQEYIQKPGRDIRAFVVGEETIGAIYRTSENWITNTARGGIASNCPITPEIDKICHDTSKAIGGGLLAIDLFETDDGFTVNEVNHTMEFRNSITTTGVNIPQLMIEYVIKQAKL